MLTEFKARRTGAIIVAGVITQALESEKPKSSCHGGCMSGTAALLELLPQTLVDSLPGHWY